MYRSDYFRLSHFGQPAPFSHSDDFFDRETTSDEKISQQLNPVQGINPFIRVGVTNLQQIEAHNERKPYPTRMFFRPLLDLVLNPQRKK
ncbi:hypothetical protein B4U80_06042 [Leptotrombidium deliense]|uniref:Uncharacterized protein n=1 Tax=Leptotrombidium deliense TaxID=299467 RepID=A0A443RUF2_9ACAR|nr:hypothetical protein B4U80_06042 [Leptotrombidium deliense]